MASAFEAVTSRQAWYASEALARNYAVQFDANGKFALADGTRPFAGIVQYGADAAGEMVTIVKGDFPVVAQEVIPAGSLVTIASGADKGTFKIADAAADKVYGVALTGATAKGELFTISMLPVATVIA